MCSFIPSSREPRWWVSSITMKIQTRTTTRMRNHQPSAFVSHPSTGLAGAFLTQPCCCFCLLIETYFLYQDSDWLLSGAEITKKIVCEIFRCRNACRNNTHVSCVSVVCKDVWSCPGLHQKPIGEVLLCWGRQGASVINKITVLILRDFRSQDQSGQGSVRKAG